MINYSIATYGGGVSETMGSDFTLRVFFFTGKYFFLNSSSRGLRRRTWYLSVVHIFIFIKIFMLMLPHSSYNSESSFSNCSMTHSSDFPLGYNSLVAIQSSAFLMTLYRKKIITGKTHMLVYSGCLVCHLITLSDF